MIALLAFSCKPISSEQNSQESKNQDKYYTFQVLYPLPTNSIQFEKDYLKHLNFLDSLMGYSHQDKPYYITKMDKEVFGIPSTFYQMFTMTFETREKLEETINSKEMEEAGKDAMRISSGGAPVVLIGKKE
ncbi:EthD family reductase [Aquimarina litoralis]|nr:EthD family reductase [Aquimarina litoralis]